MLLVPCHAALAALALPAVIVVPAWAQSCTTSGNTTNCEVPNGDSFTYNAAITQTNLLVNATSPNNGTLTLGGTNTQTNTTIDAGEVNVSSAANLGGAGGGLTLTLGGTQAGGGAAFGNLLETTDSRGTAASR